MPRVAHTRTPGGRSGHSRFADKQQDLQLAELRRRIADLEGRLPFETQLGPAPASAALEQGPAGSSPARAAAAGDDRLTCGLRPLDDLFQAPGLQLATLHELVSAHSRDAGALSGFCLALVASLMAARSGQVLWVLDPQVAREAGWPHGSGLARFGVDPARVIAVMPRRPEEILWAMEEGAGCAALAAVVGEVQGAPKAVDLTATRRLLLRARSGGVPVFLVRHGADREPTAALTRWCVAPAVSTAPPLIRQGPHDAIGNAAWTVTLTRNRDGRPGRLDLEWSHAARQLAAPARALPVVSGACLRPDIAPVADRVTAVRTRG